VLPDREAAPQQFVAAGGGVELANELLDALQRV